MPKIDVDSQVSHDFEGTVFTAIASPALGATDTSVWRVQVPATAIPVPHHMTREEIIVATAGGATFRLGDEVHDVRPGDAMVLPAGRMFTLEASPTEGFEGLVCLPVGGQAVIPGNPPFTPPWAA